MIKRGLVVYLELNNVNTKTKSAVSTNTSESKNPLFANVKG
jgi:hypothetical protein